MFNRVTESKFQEKCIFNTIVMLLLKQSFQNESKNSNLVDWKVQMRRV